MQGNYKDAGKERDNLKKSTQAKFMKLTHNHKPGEKLVRFSQILLSLSMFTCFTIKDKEAEDIVSKPLIILGIATKALEISCTTQ